MGEAELTLDFYRGKRVFITGHTGFKGSWLCALLLHAGAEVWGCSLEPPTEPNLFTLAGLEARMHSIRGDVRDHAALKAAFDAARPEIVFHMAAQPIVRESYRRPRETYETNVLGTVNLLECVRLTPGVRSVLNVTTDKVYLNRERGEGYREEEPLDGYDPYSNSKSCSELVTHSYARSFFTGGETAISTARAGNVIGGGDFAADRLIPDCLRAVQAGKPVILRNPNSVRPFQHVLDALWAYLLIAQAQAENPAYAGSYNVGPEDADCVTAGELAELFCRCWGQGAAWEHRGEENAPHEAALLRLNCDKLKTTLGWRERWGIRRAVEMTCRFGKVWLSGGDVPAEMEAEITAFLNGGEADA